MPRRPVQYDVLLRVRRLQEDLKAQALASARREVQTAEQQRDALLEDRRLVFEEVGVRARHRFNAFEIRLFYQYERLLARLTDDKDAEIDRLQGVAESRRLELESAMKRRRMVEKLRERKLDVFEAEVRRGELKLSDEMATNAASMKRAAARRGPAAMIGEPNA